jgi:hypothetical protein
MSTNAFSVLAGLSIVLALPVERAESQVKEGDTGSFAVEHKDLASHSKFAADQSKALIPKNDALNTPINLKIEILSLIASGRFALDPGTSGSSSWAQGPLVEVSSDGAISPLRESTKANLAIGHPAFKTLSIERIARRDPDGGAYWRVSGTIVSTNAGFPVKDAVVYVKASSGHWTLKAISNLKGEVLFTVPLTSAYIYFATHATGLPSPSQGTVLREYKCTSTPKA